jgi:hypothetical protein
MQNAKNLLHKYFDYLTKLKHIKLAFFLVLVVLLVTSYFFSSQTNNIFVRSSSYRNPGQELTNSNRLFCIILAMPDSYKSNTALVALSAWVHKCDNYRFISRLPNKLQARPINNTANRTDDGAGSFGNEIEEPLNILHPSGLYIDEYLKLTYKVFKAIREIYLKYFENGYDWYLKVYLLLFFFFLLAIVLIKFFVSYFHFYLIDVL